MAGALSGSMCVAVRDSATPLAYQVLRSSTRAKSASVVSGAVCPVLSLTCSTAEALGLSSANAEVQNYEDFTTANPDTEWFWQVSATSYGATIGVLIKADVVIDYRIRFSKRLSLLTADLVNRLKMQQDYFALVQSVLRPNSQFRVELPKDMLINDIDYSVTKAAQDRVDEKIHALAEDEEKTYALVSVPPGFHSRAGRT